ncbi:hypothetical protein ARMSODRAFT_1014692 [Armillaria solidipes]|uniref:Uncharacterized protein n=1 Tax=Armillaria solidipes TaxID=1076256 RepID=A0A2H3BXT1_9AGAR|nr:hypothetical protein ARMSODRAFT_1014692 [Armillaria solidipes]
MAQSMRRATAALSIWPASLCPSPQRHSVSSASRSRSEQIVVDVARPLWVGAIAPLIVAVALFIITSDTSVILLAAPHHGSGLGVRISPNFGRIQACSTAGQIVRLHTRQLGVLGLANLVDKCAPDSGVIAAFASRINRTLP